MVEVLQSSRSELGGVWPGGAGNMLNSDSGDSWQELRLASLVVVERLKPSSSLDWMMEQTRASQVSSLSH